MSGEVECVRNENGIKYDTKIERKDTFLSVSVFISSIPLCEHNDDESSGRCEIILKSFSNEVEKRRKKKEE